jgi:hypothetical protein
MNTGKIDYVTNSFVNYGNDGNHYNDSINHPPNAVVSQQIANAIHYASDHLPIFLKLKFESNNVQMSVSLNDGWNILSVPLEADKMTASTLFPTAASQFYSFTSTYNQVTVLENGEGYWAKFNGNQNVSITGIPIINSQISVNQGWNIIGPFDFDIAITELVTIPPNIIVSPFYGFDETYHTTNTLYAGKGYWVKSSVNGVIILE